MPHAKIAILHYSASPVVGGVEAVIDAHAQLLVQMGYAVTVVAGRGERDVLPAGVELLSIPAMDTQHPEVLATSAELEQGSVPPAFQPLKERLVHQLAAVLPGFDTIIVHNILTKHFNLPLTAALFDLFDAGLPGKTVAWCHDFTWTSPNSRAKVRPGYPWDFLRTYRPDLTYVTVSEERQRALAQLLGCPRDQVRVIYNGVDPTALLGLSAEGAALIHRLRLFDADLIMLMPVRVTTAKNVEFALQVVAALKHQGVRPLLVLTGPPDPHDEKSMGYYHTLQAQRAALGVEQEMRFVFESGPDPAAPHRIPASVVGDLYRVADLLFMPSHREGFGMPVLEAGLAGIPVVASRAVPAAVELAHDAALLLNADDAPDRVAQQIRELVAADRGYRLRRRVRQRYTWDAIFEHDFKPLLGSGEAA
ncbi:MAG: glycosyltransferase family 4 protein [Caldilineaceae bacterium]|nr:glycosyltransferase family 4 protein [Caldilineaceae bacterium]